jgi:hypothetical protein
LTELNASASPASGSGEGSSGGTLRAAAAGPALVLSGCATGQESVAGFVTGLKDIDGVTRVGVESSELSDQEEGAGSTGESSETEAGGTECRTRKFITKFNLVVAFDAAPIPLTAEGEAEAPVPPAESAETTASEGE